MLIKLNLIPILTLIKLLIYPLMSDQKETVNISARAQKHIVGKYNEIVNDVSLHKEGCKFLSLKTSKEELKNYDASCAAVISLELTAIHPSVYQGNKFLVDIICSNKYPFVPPIVIFKTPIKHVNICKSGKVMHSFFTHDWSPVNNVLAVIIIEMLLLFTIPRPDDVTYQFDD